MKLTSVIILLIIFTHCANTNEKEKTPQQQIKVEEKNPSGNNINVQIFQRKKEPRENAFSILVPKDWVIEGGIFRVDPTAQGGHSQSIAAKLDFTVKNKAGTVMIRWLPDVLYFDARNSPAGQMELFPQGSNYQGMTVVNLMTAENFIAQIAFPYAHPNAESVQIIDRKKLKDVAHNYTKRVKQAMPYSTMSYDAALVKLNFYESGKQYEEILVSIIENWGQLGAGMWGNKETFLVKAPVGKLENYKSVFSTIQNSVKLNINWLTGELKGQITRGKIAINTQQEIQKIGKEIAEHRQKTNTEINNDLFLTLTEQEEYVNPYTNEIEIGTNQWKHRWVNKSGDIIYTDNEDYNPNTDINLNRSDFKRSKIRKRLPN